VDDGSTDQSAAVAESFGPPVRVIRQANQGPAVARNRGLAEAQGEWVHFFDSDDLALPNLHAEQLRVLEASGADVAYAPWLKCEISEQAIVPTNNVLQHQGLPHGNLVHALLTNWSVVPICCLIRTSLARQVGGFPAELHGTEDQLFFLRLLLAGAQVVHSPGTFVVYRADNPGKLSAGGDGKHLRQWARFLLMAREACLLNGIDPSHWFDFRLRVWDARASLAAQAETADQTLIEALHQLENGPWPELLYPLRRSIRRKGGGISLRLLGRRAHRSFRAGAPNASQLAQLQQFVLPA
jgi:glycosyltransferase involved in cell wall biosynthesis